MSANDIIRFYLEGYDAFLEGKDCTQNPYENGTSEAIEWRNGWDQAEEEDTNTEDQETTP